MDTNNNAKKYSKLLFNLGLDTKFLIKLPKSAHKLIHGKLTNDDINPVKTTAIQSFSSKGIKPDATVIAIVHALGFTH